MTNNIKTEVKECIVGAWEYEEIVNLKTGAKIIAKDSPLNGLIMEFNNNGQYFQRKLNKDGTSKTKEGKWEFVNETKIKTYLKKTEKWVFLDIVSCETEKLILKNNTVKIVLIKYKSA
jgi:hypothetical protein